jgi:hypothetical protein
VSRRCASISVAVIAVGKFGASIEQKLKPTLAELIAEAIQVIGTKLVNHNYDDQLGVGIVGRAEGTPYEKRKKQDWDCHHAQGELHRRLVYSLRGGVGMWMKGGSAIHSMNASLPVSLAVR